MLRRHGAQPRLQIRSLPQQKTRAEVQVLVLLTMQRWLVSPRQTVSPQYPRWS